MNHLTPMIDNDGDHPIHKRPRHRPTYYFLGVAIGLMLLCFTAMAHSGQPDTAHTEQGHTAQPDGHTIQDGHTEQGHTEQGDVVIADNGVVVFGIAFYVYGGTAYAQADGYSIYRLATACGRPDVVIPEHTWNDVENDFATTCAPDETPHVYAHPSTPCEGGETFIAATQRRYITPAGHLPKGFDHCDVYTPEPVSNGGPTSCGCD